MPVQDARFLIKGHLLQVVRDDSRKLIPEEILDAALVVDKDGVIVDKGSFTDLQPKYAALPVKDYGDAYILPSFFDTHLHFPQLDMMGSCSPELLLWLQNYTFPREAAFRGRGQFVKDAARTFVDSLASNGTTTAVVFSSSCGDATDVLFEEFDRRGLRVILGKTSMDQHCPADIAVELNQDREWTEELISKWHGRNDRLYYALTPRFAPSCTEELLAMQAEVYRSEPSLYLQTHYAENHNEIAWVKELFPRSKSYLDVYDSRELLRDRTILAHSIHTHDEDEQLLLKRGVVLSHCPTSNLFLGSGLFKARAYLDQGQKVTLGTDVGAGTSFSQWQTMNEAYKVAQLRQERVSPIELFAMASLMSAEGLGFKKLGQLSVGYEADLQIIHPESREILSRHMSRARDTEEKLAALIHFVDDRCLSDLYVRGQLVWNQKLRIS